MSFNEIQWWQAYANLRPLEPDRLDMMEARIVGSFAGKAPDSVQINWFSMEHDEEWCLERDKATKERLAKKQQALNEKLEKEKLENGTQTN